MQYPQHDAADSPLKARFTPSRAQSSATLARVVVAVAAFVAIYPTTVAAAGAPSPVPRSARATSIQVRLSEWAITLSARQVAPGAVTFEITNTGSIPHAFEVEGNGIEREAPQIPRGGSGRLAVTLRPGHYELYCPIGNGSHKMLGMRTRLAVVAGGRAKRAAPAMAMSMGMGMGMGMEHDMRPAGDSPSLPKALAVMGGGDVIQMLPGPFPFADSAAAVIESRPDDQRGDLTAKSKLGPYSNNVHPISGTIQVLAIDHGAAGDSVSGIAAFTAQDGARWKVVMDRVQTHDIPDNPRFGGVIMGLFYHGASGVHTPLVPTIQSSLALWAFAHLFRNDTLVTDDAMVHVMLLSRTRRQPDWALECWDCTRNPIEELQLQVTPAPGESKFASPGGFLFVNWEKSSGEARPVEPARGASYGRKIPRGG